MKDELLYREEVFSVIGVAFEVYNELGSGFLESVYQEAMLEEAKTRDIPLQPQVKLQVMYKGKALAKEFYADFVAYGKIIIELKAIVCLGHIEQAQLLNYLKASGVRLGLLLNFGAAKKLEWKRLVL